jgi:hypothetical protein
MTQHPAMAIDIYISDSELKSSILSSGKILRYKAALDSPRLHAGMHLYRAADGKIASSPFTIVSPLF